MNAYSFPVDLVQDGDTVLATFPGLEGATFGEDEADAVHKAELARRCGWHATQVDRLLDITHNSRMDHLERALAVLGKRIQITVRDAA